MKAAVFHGQRDVKGNEVKAPEVQAGGLKVKADWCRRCRTDRHEYLAGPIVVHIRSWAMMKILVQSSE